jgi:hypothetical protein
MIAVYTEDPSTNIQGYIAFTSSSSAGAWSLKLLEDTPTSLWFAVMDYDAGKFYVATSAVSTSGSVSLDIALMPEITQ